MKAMILGGAACVWHDVAALEKMVGRWAGLVIAANDVGCHWSRELHHWCSLHPEKFDKWKAERRAAGHPNGYVTWGKRQRRNVDRQVQTWGGGSSGLLAVTVAKEIGCDRIVLCGVPMTKEPHFIESKVHVKGRKWASSQTHFKVWTRNESRMQGWVKSMSGRTRDLLGEPTREWLEGGDA